MFLVSDLSGVSDYPTEQSKAQLQRQFLSEQPHGKKKDFMQKTLRFELSKILGFKKLKNEMTLRLK